MERIQMFVHLTLSCLCLGCNIRLCRLAWQQSHSVYLIFSSRWPSYMSVSPFGWNVSAEVQTIWRCIGVCADGGWICRLVQ